MSSLILQNVQWLAGSAALAGLGAFVYANRIEPNLYRLETVKVTTGGATSPPGGARRTLRILHLSDLHLCYPEKSKVRFLEEVTDEEYDIVALTGDVFENLSGCTYWRSLLSRKPRLGAFAVLGNHDYYNYSMFNKTFGRVLRKHRHPSVVRDVAPMVKALELAGFQVMRNEASRTRDDGVHVVGIDYPTIKPEKLKELSAGAPPQSFRLVLFHLPVRLDEIRDAGAHLALGGHTHGGQIRIPGLGAVITDSELPRSEACGLFFRGETAFHISRGLGADPRSNIRLFCPPAATALEVAW